MPTGRLIRSYPLFKTTEEPKTNIANSPPPLQPDGESDSDTIPYVPSENDNNDHVPEPVDELKQILPQPKKGKLVTKTFGVRRQNKNPSKRKYTCATCTSVHHERCKI